MNRRIIRLALPAIISNITVPLLGLVDVAITGHLGEARYMAAIAIGAMVFNIMYWLFSFLRFGTGGMTAQAFGREDNSEGAILYRSLLRATCIALCILILQYPLFKLAIWFVVPDETIVNTLYTYYSICVWGALPSLILYVLTGWLVGMQNTKLPMIVSMAQNIINICLSCVLVYVAGMKIEGVALGTVIAQWTGALMAGGLIMRKYGSRIGKPKRNALFVKEKSKHVNSTLFLRTLFLIAVNVYFIKAGARGGEIILAVNSILMQLFTLYTYVMDGFAFAAEALCGRYYGAADKVNYKSALHGVWKWSVGLTLIYTMMYALGGDVFVRILTDNETVRNVAQDYLLWAAAIPFCGMAAFVWDGVFVGITKSMAMVWTTLGGAVAFFSIYLLLWKEMGNHALWFAFNAYLFVRGLVASLLSPKYN